MAQTKVPKVKHVPPECENGEKKDMLRDGVFLSNLSNVIIDSDRTYKSLSGPVVCINGKWKEDVEESKRQVAERAAAYEVKEKRRKELWFALRSRVLTIDEMKEVETWGEQITGIATYTYVAFGSTQSRSEREDNGADKAFNDALLQQFKLQVLAKEHLKCGDVQP